MPTDIEIASNALLLVGDNPINSFDEPGAGAQAAANLYQPIKEAAIAWHPWSFALKEQELSRLSQTPDPRTDFTYAYQIPTDVIRIWEVMRHSYYEIVGDVIYSNETDLYMRYGFNQEATRFPAQFATALQYKLAAEFSLSVTEDENRFQLYTQKANIAMAQAATIDSQGRPQKAVVDSPFVDARYRGEPAQGFLR